MIYFLNHYIMRGNMETIVFLITNKEDGLAAITYFCNAIKDREDANHQLYFSRRLMGMYAVFNSQDPDKMTKEIIFCPSYKVEDLKGKNIIDTRNCMWFVGESDISKARLQGTIDWMLDKGGILKES